MRCSDVTTDLKEINVHLKKIWSSSYIVAVMNDLFSKLPLNIIVSVKGIDKTEE